MKIKISNLGVVKEAEIDLKPLTVFIGENNTGKTWTAYTLASIFGVYGFNKHLEAYINEEINRIYPSLEETIKIFSSRNSSSMNFVEFCSNYSVTYINDVANLVSNLMPSCLGTNRVSFNNLNIVITGSRDKYSEFVRETINLRGEIYFEATKTYFSKKFGEENIYFYTIYQSHLDESVKPNIPERIIKELLSKILFQSLHRSLFLNVRVFPVERTTLSAIKLDEFRLEENKTSNLSLVKETDEFVDPNVVQYFTGMLLKIFNQSKDIRKQQIKLSPQIADYVNLANFAESEILGGTVDIEEMEFRKEVIFRLSENHTPLEISIASSMVKELAPLVLYLKYLAEPNDLIVIDEPEMNLHPAAQVEMAEFLAMLVQADLNVLITTHSPYIVDHLANLMQAAKQEDKDSIKDKFYLERTDAFIPQEKVSVYLFEDGTAKNILREDGRIDWGTFSNVSEDLLTIADMIS